MLQTHLTSPSSLGADQRALRKARGMTLLDMGAALGRSVGWLSQVERDLSEPSITDLRHIAATLDIAVSTLFRRGAAPVEEEGQSQSRDCRNRCRCNDRRCRDQGKGARGTASGRR